MQHTIEFKKDDGKYTLDCSCGWHAFTWQFDRAERWLSQHLSNAGIIKREQPSVVDGKQE